MNNLYREMEELRPIMDTINNYIERNYCHKYKAPISHAVNICAEPPWGGCDACHAYQGHKYDERSFFRFVTTLGYYTQLIELGVQSDIIVRPDKNIRKYISVLKNTQTFKRAREQCLKDFGVNDKTQDEESWRD